MAEPTRCLPWLVGLNGSGNYSLTRDPAFRASGDPRRGRIWRRDLSVRRNQYGLFPDEWIRRGGIVHQYGGQLYAASETFGVNGYGSGQFYQSGGANTVSSPADRRRTAPVIISRSIRLPAAASFPPLRIHRRLGNRQHSRSRAGPIGGQSVLGYNTGSSGTYSLSGSGLLSELHEYIGYSGTGSFTQTGGTHSVSGDLYLGYNAGGSGTYNLSGSGLLSASDEYIGILRQRQLHAVGRNQFGVQRPDSSDTFAGGSGTYNLSGSGQLSALYEYIGDPVLELTPGPAASRSRAERTRSVVSSLAQSSVLTGTYNLNGGLLSLGRFDPGLRQRRVQFQRRNLPGRIELSTNVPIVLSTAGSNGVFNTNGNTLTLAGPLSGPGGLQKIGAGTLTLAASNGYTGTTLVSNGTLLLGDPNALAGSTFDTSGAGSLSFGTLTSATFGGLQGSGNLALNNANSAAVALTVGGNNASTTFSGTSATPRRRQPDQDRHGDAGPQRRQHLRRRHVRGGGHAGGSRHALPAGSSLTSVRMRRCSSAARCKPPRRQATCKRCRNRARWCCYARRFGVRWLAAAFQNGRRSRVGLACAKAAADEDDTLSRFLSRLTIARAFTPVVRRGGKGPFTGLLQGFGRLLWLKPILRERP